MCAAHQATQPVPNDGYIPVENGHLYYREVGQGRPIIVIHGGPGFDHTYLLPDMDRLSDSYRLVYYDQRGRGKSAGDLPNISIKTEVEDLDGLREHLGLDSVALLGHSWGGLLAMEYAIRHPGRVSHMILLNTCVASHEDFELFDDERRQRLSIHEAERKALHASAKYKEGDPETVTKAYQLYFSTTIKRPEHLERLDLGFMSLANEDILRARKIAEHMFNTTLLNDDYDLIPDLKAVSAPTLIIHGDYDFIPLQTVAPIAKAITGAHLVLLKDCGHFSYIEAPEEVRQVIADFFPEN